MHKLTVFNFVSIDGFFAGPHGEIDWFKSIGADPEYQAYTHGQAVGGSILMFGHTTYEMMKSFWPTDMALKNDPHMAGVMNNSQKVVFSKTFQDVKDEGNWKNVTVLNEINPAEILKLKAQKGITILGSGTIVQQLSNLGLIDEYQLLIVPIVLGKGKTLFEGVKEMKLELIEERAFKNGIISVRYVPVK